MIFNVFTLIKTRIPFFFFLSTNSAHSLYKVEQTSFDGKMKNFTRH